MFQLDHRVLILPHGAVGNGDLTGSHLLHRDTLVRPGSFIALLRMLISLYTSVDSTVDQIFY